MNNFKIKKISEYKDGQLLEFYHYVFKDKNQKIIENFKWVYRYGLSNYEPLLLEIDNKIVGQAGLIPNDFLINEKKFKGIWFTDFIILPEYQKKGYGKILTEKWMEISPLKLTFCNDLSLKIFLKQGWQTTNAYFRYILPLNLTNLISLPGISSLKFIDKIYHKLIVKNFNQLNNLTTKKNIDDKISLISNHSNIKQDNFFVLRDSSWLKWRLLDCPYKENLIMFEYESEFLFANIINKNNQKKLNIIYSTKYEDSVFFDLIKNWAIKNNFDYLWFVCNKEIQSLSWCLSKKVNFAYKLDNFANDAIDIRNTNFQAIDSDLDFI